MKTQLKKWQQEGRDKGIEILVKSRMLAIYFDPQMGKSVTALSIAEELYVQGIIKFVVIIVPANLRDNFNIQVKTHSDILNDFFIWDTQKKNGKMYQASLECLDKRQGLIVNYEEFRDTNQTLAVMLRRVLPSTLCIVDEETAIKNVSAKQTKGISNFFSRAWGRIGMTGTEFGNSVLDLYGPWEYRQKYFWLIPSFDKFKKRYEKTMPVLDHDGNFSHEVHVGWQRIDEIHDKINPYTIRAKREDWLPTVEETHEPVFFKLHPAERKAYDELKKQMFTILENGEEITITQRNQFYMRARTITGGWATLEERISPVPSKAEILYDLLFDENSQCIVWCIFRHEVEYLTKFLNDKEIPTVGYSGDTTNTEKTPTIQKFQNGEARVIVANEAMSKGFSLQMCNNHIFYTLPNKSLNFYQQKDRSAGIGAKDQIFYRYLMAMDTVDTKIKSMLDENQDLLYSFQTGTLKQIVDLLQGVNMEINNKLETSRAYIKRYNYLKQSHLLPHNEESLKNLKKLDLPIAVLEKALEAQKIEVETIVKRGLVDEFRINGNIGEIIIDGFRVTIERHVSGKILDMEGAYTFFKKYGYDTDFKRTWTFEKGAEVKKYLDKIVEEGFTVEEEIGINSNTLKADLKKIYEEERMARLVKLRETKPDSVLADVVIDPTDVFPVSIMVDIFTMAKIKEE